MSFSELTMLVLFVFLNIWLLVCSHTISTLSYFWCVTSVPEVETHYVWLHRLREFPDRKLV